MTNDCKEKEQAIITKLEAASLKIYTSAALTDEEIINKIYSINHACPSIVSSAFSIAANKDKDYPCFWINRETFQILKISHEELIPGQKINAEITFKYGTDTNEHVIKNVTLVVENDDVLFLPNIQYVYPPRSFAVLLEQENMTVNQFQDYLIEGVMNQFFWKSGLKEGVVLEKNTDYTLYYHQLQGPEDPNNPIWDETKAKIYPGFKRKAINFELWIMAINTSKYIKDVYHFKIYAYEKIDLAEIIIEKQIFKAKSLHDTYQNVIDNFKNLVFSNANQSIRNLINENYWPYDSTYPEFNWNHGADFAKEINDDIEPQLKLSIKDHDPAEEITTANIEYVIEANEGINAFKKTFNFSVEVELFVRYKLEELTFSSEYYEAKTSKDTYRDALNAIKDKIKKFLVEKFKEERITEIDFFLSTEDEDTIINQEKTIKVTINAVDNSEWLSGENQFELNVKHLLIFKPFRQFKLINSLQDEIDLQDLNLVVGSIDGDLGVSFKNNYLQIENDFIFTQKSNNLNNINFNLTFLAPNAYDKYYEFIKFLTPNISNNKPLTLSYKIFYKTEVFNKNYNCEIFLKTITKTELNNLNNLEVQINFEKISNWKNFIIQQLEFESNTLELTNNGQVPTPAIIEIYDASTNPYFILKNEQNEVLAESKINYQIQEGEVLTIDSRLTEQKIMLKRKEEEINLFDSQDFTKKTFIFIPPGTTKLEYQNEKGEERIYVSFEEQFISI